ncbi:organic hydroperoxide resistance protein [Nocardia sp. NBC_01503]|uniref:organic hydroperoxide resistance protein n=1 Tax=Nocardia sp. NBC_01503 TaxID=2975997 RepID=UPI002E7BAC85|nr:organic hydroperoxide resistance protein [Nocardia sp. NBC_01503]WTL32508.1 organic hydroperoxide resistance protein [Nocardia sp. NBC_01503]
MAPLYTAVATSVGRDGRSYTDDGILDLTLARPKEMGGDGAGTNPEQLFAAGYSACFASALGLVSKRMNLDASDASVTAEVGLNALEGGAFGLSVVLRVELPEHLHNEQGQALIEATHQVCPYSNATRGNIPVELVVE